VAPFESRLSLFSRIANGYPSGVQRTKMPRDSNQLAKRVVDLATGQRSPEPQKVKDPAAIARGHLGGVIGGKVRASRMTPAERSASASLAAKARWERERQT
jgi:hypothetical protein